MQPTRSGRSARAFTLAEILLVLLVLLLAGLLLFSVVGRVHHQSQREQFGAELRAMAADLEKNHASSGRWPATTVEAARLIEDSWPEASPWGGRYGWMPPDPRSGRPGRIELTAFVPDFPLTLTRADLLEIDRRIDNGDLATGRFRTGFNGWPVYLVGTIP